MRGPMKEMKRKNDAMHKSGTHFEQIPLVVVKKIAASDGGAGPDVLAAKPASRKGVPASVTARAPRKGR
jgi:hypothetical protein